MLLPQITGELSLGGLGDAVLMQQIHQRDGQGDGAPPGVGLRLHDDQTLALLALQRLAHAQRAAVKVDGVPRQPEGLALAQPEGEGDRPAGAVALAPSRVQDPARLLGGEGALRRAASPVLRGTGAVCFFWVKGRVVEQARCLEADLQSSTSVDMPWNRT